MIRSGESKSGILKSVLEAHNWTYEAKAGEEFLVRTTFQTNEYLGDRISIISPNGELVDTCGDIHFGCSSYTASDTHKLSEIKYKPTMTGVYTIRLDMFEGADGTYSISVSSSQSPTRPYEIILDDADPGVVFGGPPPSWRIAKFGYKGSTHWTFCTDKGVSNWAKWIPQLPSSGNYTVFVFVPERDAGSTKARYHVFHNGIDSQAIVRQADYANEWVSIGTYWFAANGKEYVYLDDNTGESLKLGIPIGFDAVKFVYVP
jgi:hypothetical protein